MRFHTVTISGFGPFAGSERIDFERLGTAGLFLLTGPTGAGKTTLLDAICYALFNETTAEGQATASVDGRSGAELRCAKATPEQPTAVELEFTVGGRLYKVERNPAYERAKRGGGVTKEGANATLARWTGASRGTAGQWEPIAAKVREVTDRIVEITGFTADQFRRVIVIPQGRFRDVLISTADAREDLLKRIFGTYVFEQFEGRVADLSREAQHARSLAQGERQRLLAPLDWAPGLDDASVATRLAAELDSAREVATVAAHTLAAAAAAHEEAAKQVGAASEMARLVTSLAEATARRGRAEAELGRIEPDRGVLVAARAAAEPARLQDEYRVAEGQRAVAAAELVTIQQAANTAAHDEKAKAGACAAAKLKLAEAAVGDRRLAEIGVRLADADAATLRHESAEKQVASTTAAEQAAREAVMRARGAAVEANDDVAVAERELADARRLRENGTAAVLAATLGTGCPCPVCGSTSHPAPAKASGDIPSDAAIQQRERRSRAAREAVDAAVAKAAKAAADLQGATAQAEAARSLLVANPPPLDVAVLQSEQAAIIQGQRMLKDSVATAKQEMEAATAAASAIREKLNAAQGVLVLLNSKATQAAGALTAALAASPFSTAEALDAAAREPAVIEVLAAGIAAADQEANTARELEEAARRDLAGRTAPNIEALEAAGRAAHETRKGAQDADEAARQRVESLRNLFGSHATRANECAAADSRFETASHLQQMVTGAAHPDEKISLHRWVLGAVLEQVVAHATTLLRQMTRGRYELVRSTSLGDRKTLAGLEIDVHDVWSGTRRGARTLSGGETFLASLALSLALAKTAEEHQGGRRLETVFIDEGFGTLDSETLDYAMAALQALRAEGRVVGVISHVEEMQRTIPAQLRLIRRGETTTTEIVGIPE